MDERELAFAGVAGQADLVRRREVSVRELIETTLRRIERLDPRLNAFRSVYGEQAIEEAKRAQRRLRASEPPALLGVPVAIKDNFDVAGDITTHGTSAHGDAASSDAEVVRRVREAGAIVVGKAHLPPLAAMGTTESATFGATRNPWAPDRSTGGSSGGSAAAVAAGLVPAALATDGAGSIRIPAAFCGLFGLKPQRGRVSMAPLAEHWYGLTVAGWEVRSPADAALMLDLTAGPSPVDAEPAAAPHRPFSEAAGESPPKLRIACSMSPPPGYVGVRVSEAVRRAVLDQARRLEALGHAVSQRDPDYGSVVVPDIALYLRGIADEARSLPRFDRLERRFRNWTRIAERIPDAAVRRAREARATHAARINRLFDDFDVLMTPLAAEPPFDNGRWEGLGAVRTVLDMGSVFPFTGTWNYTGNPAASVPAGWTADGLPLAVQLVARPGDEHTLISLAEQLRAHSDWTARLPPGC